MQPRSLPTRWCTSTRCYITISSIGKSVRLLLRHTTYAIFPCICVLLLPRPKYSPRPCGIRATNTTTGSPKAVSCLHARYRVTLFTYWNSLCSFLTPYLLTYSMEHTPSREANWFSASHEIPHILWNPNIHYRSHKCPLPVSILSQLDPVHTPASYFLKIHLNIILPFTPGSPKWPISLRFSHQKPEYASPISNTRYMPRPSHYSRFYHLKNIGWMVQIIKPLIKKFPLLSCYSSLLDQNILLSTLFLSNIK